MKTKELICVSCPIGCAVTVTLDDNNEVVSVTGNTCRRGEDYARREVTAPARVLTTTVPVVGGVRPRVPVKTAGEVPKTMVLACARALAGVEVAAPVRAGDVVCRDILGTGVDVIAVRDTPKA